MPSLNNSQWERFCLNYFGSKTKKESAISAGYSPKTAQQIASRLLRKVKVLERLQELQQAAASAEIASVRQRKEILTQIIRATVVDFIESDVNGLRININSENMNSAVLQQVSTQTVPGEDGGQAVLVTGIKLHDSVKAIAELNKMEGVY